MNPRLFLLATVFVLVFNKGIAEDQKQKSVRQIFAPAKTEHGASWSTLHSGGPGQPFKGAYWLQACAGVGDKFPVREEGKPVLFEVEVLSGNNDQLLVEVRSKEMVQKITVVRYKRTIVESGGRKYELLYPSTSKAAKDGEQPTTNQAMLIISRQP